jgi:uncharacterized tellurite resistance protein B-like protein
MRFTDLGTISRIFRGAELEEGERKALFKEVMLMTLARATDSDSNVANCEIETVQRILKETIGEDFSSADIRVAAASELYETAPLEKYLERAGHKLRIEERVATVQALAEVIKSDVRIHTPEVRFLNMVADALDLTPAEVMGVIPEE